MVQLKILSGKMAGAAWLARRFPLRIGRDAAADLQLEQEGVWEQHLEIRFQPTEGFLLRSRPEAPVTVNGQSAEQTLLHNGDVLEIGCLKLQFWVGETRQRGLALREALTWIGIAAVVLGEAGLIFWLVR